MLMVTVFYIQILKKGRRKKGRKKIRERKKRKERKEKKEKKKEKERKNCIKLMEHLPCITHWLSSVFTSELYVSSFRCLLISFYFEGYYYFYHHHHCHYQINLPKSLRSFGRW